MKVALVHDWLLAPGGAELVLAALHRMWPEAPIFTLLLDRQRLPDALADADIRTSYLDRWKWPRRHHTKCLPLMPSAIESFDLSGFDVVISSSHCVAKGALVRAGQAHLCYCHTPMRYAWDLQEEYLRAANLHRGIRGALARAMLSRVRTWDVASATRVDRFIANSSYVASRIQRAYGREAGVIHPPVDVESFQPAESKGDHFVTASRLVAYKRVDLIIEAANRTGSKLVVFGSGPMEARLRELAGPTVELRGWAPEDDVRETVATARAFITAANEDFGISTAEALAAGTPVIGLDNCGTADIVADGRTGVLYPEQSVDALTKAIRRFVEMESRFEPDALRRAAMRFSESHFRQAILTEVNRLWQQEQRNEAAS